MSSMGLGGVAAQSADPDQPTEIAAEERTALNGATGEEFAEIDWQGSKYQIPAALKDAFLQNADYTQKTQALADDRRTLEQLRDLAQTGALDREFQTSIADESREMAVIDAYLAQVSKTDWANMTTDQMLRHKVEVDNIKERRQSLKDGIEAKRQAFNTNFSTKLSELKAKARELASKSIKDFGEETWKAMQESARAEGLTDREFDSVALDPRSIKILWKAMQYDKVVKTTGKAVNAAEKVVRPGAASERMPASKAADLNFRKALGSAKTSGQKASVIEQRLAGIFSKGKP